MNEEPYSMAVARKWVDWLKAQYVLCPNDCCLHMAGRTLMQTAIWLNHLSAEEQRQQANMMNTIMDVPSKHGLAPHIGWDGLVFSRPRSRGFRGKVTKSRREVSRGLVNASG